MRARQWYSFSKKEKGTDFNLAVEGVSFTLSLVVGPLQDANAIPTRKETIYSHRRASLCLLARKAEAVPIADSAPNADVNRVRSLISPAWHVSPKFVVLLLLFSSLEGGYGEEKMIPVHFRIEYQTKIDYYDQHSFTPQASPRPCFNVEKVFSRLLKNVSVLSKRKQMIARIQSRSCPVFFPFLQNSPFILLCSRF